MRTFLLSAAVGMLLGTSALAQAPAPLKAPAAPKAPAATPAQAAPAKPATAVAAPASGAQTTAPATKSPATKPAETKKPASGAKPAAAGPEEAIRKAGKAYIAALNAGDFKTAATFWTADGEYVDKAGKGVPARKMVAEDLPKKFPEGKRPQLVVDVKSIQLLSADIAQEVGSVVVKSKEGKPGPRGGFNALWVKQQDKWLLKNIRETTAGPLVHNNSLGELSWLVGHWSAESEGTDIYIDCTWSPNKVYLLREINVIRDGKTVHSGTQRIGLDPMSPKIKSWSFDNDGGLAESFWEKIDGTWHVASRGASAHGHITSARNVYDEISADSFTLESGEAHAGSATMPAFKLKFTRDVSVETPPAASTAGERATPDTAATPPSTTPATPPQSSRPTPSAGGTDSLDKEKILGSTEWQQTQQAYNEWLSVQKIYTPAEVKKLKSDMADKIARMTAPQLRDFLEDFSEKVKILLSKDAEDVRLWLAQRMAVEVKLTPQQIAEERPDIASMTAAQVEERLKELEQERKQTQDAQKAFVADRKFRIKSINDQQKEADNEREQALNRAAEELGSGYGGYYGGGYGMPPGGFRGGYGGAGGYYGGGLGGWGGFRW